MPSFDQVRGNPPRHIITIALALAGSLVIAVASSGSACAQRAGISMPRVSSPMTSMTAPRMVSSIGGPDTKSLGGPDTKSIGGPDTKSLGGPDTKGAAKGFRGGVKTTMSAKGIIIIGGKQKAASGGGCDAQTVFCQNNLLPAVQKTTSKGPINPGTIKGFNLQPDPPSASSGH